MQILCDKKSSIDFHAVHEHLKNLTLITYLLPHARSRSRQLRVASGRTLHLSHFSLMTHDWQLATRAKNTNNCHHGNKAGFVRFGNFCIYQWRLFQADTVRFTDTHISKNQCRCARPNRRILWYAAPSFPIRLLDNGQSSCCANSTAQET